jgi:hypothetical protein
MEEFASIEIRINRWKLERLSCNLQKCDVSSLDASVN